MVARGSRTSHRRWRRRRATALLGEATAPGAGGLVTGHRRWLLAPTTIAALAGATVLLAYPGTVVRLLLTTGGLAALAVVNLTLLAVRLMHLRSTARRLRACEPVLVTTRRRRARVVAPRRPSRGVAVTAALIVVVPHLLAAAGLDVVRRTLDDVLPVAAGHTRTVPTAPPPAAAGDSDRRSPAEVEVHSKVLNDGRLDVLLIGLDAGDGRTGARNDANLVVRVDPATPEVTLIGVPRNLVRVPDPASEDDCECFTGPLYALYGHGHANPERYPDALDPGAEAVRQAVGELLGQPIDAYIAADMAAFRSLVDALGGIEVDLTEDVAQSFSDPENVHQRIAVDVGPGRHHLDGNSALAFARARADSDDYRRMARQRCLVASSASSFDGLELTEALRLARQARGQLLSDLSRSRVGDLLRLVDEIDPADIRSLGLVPPGFTSGRVGGYPVPDVARIHEALAVDADGDTAARLAGDEC